jgi:uncharacterized protein YbjT (DUF2867 family)
MRIPVFGAPGGIEEHVITLAAEHGHDVRAVYRTRPDNPSNGPVEILVDPDILDPGFGLGQSAAPTR